LLGSRIGIGLVDDFLEELASFVEVEFFEVVEGLPVGGVFSDDVAFIE
jgi:hypothetical protein